MPDDTLMNHSEFPIIFVDLIAVSCQRFWVENPKIPGIQPIDDQSL